MKEVEKYLKTRIGKYSFFFQDTVSGFTYGYNENIKMIAAGCIKLPIAVSLIKAVENKEIDFLDKVLISKKDKVYGTGIIHEFIEREYTIFELLVAMLIQSDNTASNKIIEILSIKRINDDIKKLGLKNTILNRKANDERIEDANAIENITSARDMCLIWESLCKGNFLSEDNSQMLIDILSRQQIKNKASLYIPDNLKYEISSKSGDKPGVENDTTLIRVKKGTFIFTILSKQIPNSVYGTVTLAKCGKMVWDNIDNNWN